MPFQITSADTKSDLIGLIYTFATSNGWIGVYNNGDQIGLRNGVCEIAIGPAASDSTFTDNGGRTVNRSFLHYQLSTGLNDSNMTILGHPGSPTRTEARVFNHDLASRLINVYLFTDSNISPNYIHIFYQSEDGGRWEGTSFGIINKNGMTHPDIAYVISNAFTWWQTEPNPSPSRESMNGPADEDHNWMLEWGLYQIRLQPNTLNTLFGFDDADRVISHDLSSSGTNEGMFARKTINRRSVRNTALTSRDLTSHPNQMYVSTQNRLVTGGASLWSVPLIIESLAGLQTYLGDLPDLRMCDAQNFEDAQEFNQGPDTWRSFPWVRSGLDINSRAGIIPLKETNSTFYGQAVKVII